MDTQILEEIGLSTAEIKVYLTLLELGSSTAGPIIEKSGLQSSVVHMTLIKLTAKGFITSIQEGSRHHYQATNPNNIINFINDKRDRFQQLLPQLILKQQQARQKPEVILYRGVRGIKELLLELLNADGKEHHTFGSSKKSLMLGEAWWVDYHRRRANKKIKANLLFNDSLKAWKAEAKYPLATVKYTKQGFEPLTETIIRNDKVGIIIWTDKPIGTLIHQKEAAQSYDQFFNLMWNAAINQH